MEGTQEYNLNGVIQINEREFRQISDLVYSKFGINLTDKKKALVRGRLNKLIKSLKYESFNDYYRAVMDDTSGKSLLDMVDKISTNHSYFFRESDHFEYLKNIALPEIDSLLSRQPGEELRVWCAGCAGGEEAYTLAMVLLEYYGPNLFKGKPIILGTDISLTALELANLGMYTEEKVKTVPAPYRKKYLKELGDGRVEIKAELKHLILFKRLNFMREVYPFKGRFHAVFCRNVMIYFDHETKLKLVNRFHQYMHPGAYLFIGHSESLGRSSELFKYVQPALYRKQ